MKKLQKIINVFFTNIILFKFIKKSKRFNYFYKLKKQQYNSIKNNKKLQQEKLFLLIDYACKNIPYYKNLNIKYSKETIFNDIKKFPILTKDIIRKNFNKLINKNIDRNFVKETSGGTTGEPITILHDNVFIDYGFANKILFNEWAGRKEGELMFKIWGNEKEIFNGGNKKLTDKIKEFLLGIKIINSFELDNNKIKKIISDINKQKPVLILSYVQSIYEIAKNLKNNKIKMKFKTNIMTTAGVLNNQVKKILKETIAKKVFNRYGSREVGDMACSCFNNTDVMHLNILTHFFEIINNKGIDILEKNINGKGKIIVTPLYNYVMPLIRYEIGDIAEINSINKHKCSIGFPYINNIIGREVNFFKTIDGKKIDGEYFTHLFYFKKGIKKFQVIQKDYLEIEINYIGELNKTDQDKINSKIKLVMGNKCKINWNNVKKIKATNSGKFLYTISLIK